MTAAKLQQAFGRFNAGDLAGADRLCGEALATDPGSGDALHLQGVIRLMGGRTGDALELLGRAAGIKPGDAAVLENLGVANLAAGRPAQAAAAFRQAMQLGADHGMLHMRFGLALGAQGQLREAIASLQNALARLPDDPDVRLNLGNALAEAGRMEEAVACYEQVLARHPAHIDTRFNLGAVYLRMARADDAERCFRAVLAQMPAHADAQVSLGLVHAGRGALDEAVACYRQALAVAPDHAQALNNLGNALTARGEHAQAEVCYQRVFVATPNDPDASINLGNLRLAQGRWEDARALYAKAVDSAAAGADALINLGTLLRRQGQCADALACFRRALERAPGRADCMSKIAATCLEMGDIGPAEEWYRKALAIEPANANTCRELGDVFKLAGRFDQAAVQYARALELQPDCYPALGGLIYARQHMSDWAGLPELWERARRDAIGKPGSGITPFSILAQPTTPAEQRACAHAWAQSELASFSAQRAQLGFDFSARRVRPQKLRIGYLSWDLHQHATAYLIAELFELHDRSRFEVFAYSYGPDDGSAIRARMRAAADAFVEIAPLPHLQSARAIYDDRIDILVDLKGYTQGARPQILALRPAPVQVNWLGYPGTMGMDEIDAIIADPFVIPAGAESAYSERVVRLPDCYQINDRRREVGAVPARAACGLPAQGFVFCCFNQSYKILPDVFAAWMRILQAVPGSVLWLLETNAWAVANLRQAAQAQGIAPERLVFAPIRPLADHLARYGAADLALDTHPYTSHTTGSDALWSGCPLITCAGETFASRVAGSLLHTAGLPELVTESLPAFEHLAIDLAKTPARLAQYRARLAAGRDACRLFDSPRFVRNLEQAYEDLWAHRQAASD
jgi:protein O-GlcNAc transferase